MTNAFEIDVYKPFQSLRQGISYYKWSSVRRSWGKKVNFKLRNKLTLVPNVKLEGGAEDAPVGF